MMRLLASSGPTAVRHSKRVVEYFGDHKAPLTQLLVGVPYEGMMDDYLRTNDYFGRARRSLSELCATWRCPGSRRSAQG
jgi:hypothetical protein